MEFHRSAAQPGYAWLIETVDPQPYTGVGTSLALDGQDRPHIAYHYTYGGLRYAAFDGTRWHTATVDGFDRAGIMPSLALDAAGGAHIAYRIAGDYLDLRYARDDGAGSDGAAWITATVDSQGDAGTSPSLVVDAAGQPHISYNRGSCLMYASYDGSTWQVETVACGTGWYGWCTSLELDAQGHPRISYCDCWSAGDLMYAWHDGAQWHIERVDSQGDVGLDASLALDAADQPHISYYDGAHYDLRYASFDGTCWLTETVDAAGDYTGQRTSLALDSQGHPHISYRGSMYWLRYAHLVALPYTVFLPWIER